MRPGARRPIPFPCDEVDGRNASRLCRIRPRFGVRLHGGVGSQAGCRFRARRRTPHFPKKSQWLPPPLPGIDQDSARIRAAPSSGPAHQREARYGEGSSSFGNQGRLCARGGYSSSPGSPQRKRRPRGCVTGPLSKKPRRRLKDDTQVYAFVRSRRVIDHTRTTTHITPCGASDGSSLASTPRSQCARRQSSLHTGNLARRDDACASRAHMVRHRRSPAPMSAHELVIRRAGRIRASLGRMRAAAQSYDPHLSEVCRCAPLCTLLADVFHAPAFGASSPHEEEI